MEGVPSSRDYEGGFACPLMAKDLGLAVAAAESVGAKLLLGSSAAQIYSGLDKTKDVINFFSCFFWFVFVLFVCL